MMSSLTTNYSTTFWAGWNGLPKSTAVTSVRHGRTAWRCKKAAGYNPYKMGVVGASDSHNTAAGYSQSDYFGGHGLLDATPEMRLSGKKEAGMNLGLLSTAGLGGVWAEENTRESIFAAMQRKETFGTSGVRIKVRLLRRLGFPS